MTIFQFYATPSANDVRDVMAYLKALHVTESLNILFVLPCSDDFEQNALALADPPGTQISMQLNLCLTQFLLASLQGPNGGVRNKGKTQVFHASKHKNN